MACWRGRRRRGLYIRRRDLDCDGYALFTGFHRIYIQGIRRSLRERLQGIFGDDWFQRGVLPAVTDIQRENLNVALEKWQPSDLATFLDAGHFGRIVSWNHAAVFAGIFTEIDYTLRQFRFLAAMRNDWAHIPPDGLPMTRVVAAVQTMHSLLVTLRCREALEIGRLMNQRNLGQPEISSPDTMPFVAGSEVDDNDDDDRIDALAADPLRLWHALRSYLVTEAFVAPTLPHDGQDNPQGAQVLVTVRVSNVAPASGDRPLILFENVNLEVKPNRPSSGRRGNRPGLGTLEPGQTVEQQFALYDKEVAHFEYRVSGQVDPQRFFGVQQNGTLPIGVVKPILNEFSTRFEAIGIKEPLNQVLASLTVVSPTMTLGEASQIRQELEQAGLLIEEKRNSLGSLFEEFYLDRESSLGARVREVILLLEELEVKIQAVDAAISQTNLEAIKAAVNGLEQLQLSVLQVEETIRTMLTA